MTPDPSVGPERPRANPSEGPCGTIFQKTHSAQLPETPWNILHTVKAILKHGNEDLARGGVLRPSRANVWVRPCVFPLQGRQESGQCFAWSGKQSLNDAKSDPK